MRSAGRKRFVAPTNRPAATLTVAYCRSFNSPTHGLGDALPGYNADAAHRFR